MIVETYGMPRFCIHVIHKAIKCRPCTDQVDMGEKQVLPKLKNRKAKENKDRKRREKRKSLTR
jgi:hypothetical protein